LGSKSHIGKFKIGFVTFLILLIVTILIFNLQQSFFVQKHVIAEEIVPIQNIQNLADDENVNVTVQRYYSSLPLLSTEDKKGNYVYQFNELNKDHKNWADESNLIDSASANITPVNEIDNSIEEVIDLVQEPLEVPNEELVEEPIEETEEEIVNLFDDSGWDDWDDYSELLPPTLFDPLIQTQEEYDMFNPVVTEETSYDDDFFADFYVAGEDDTAIFPDGFYYLQLVVNEELLGEIEVEFRESQYYLNGQELYNFVYNRLSDEAIDRIFGDVDIYVSIDDLIAKGVDATLDLDAFQVTLNFSLDDMPLIIIPVSEIDKKAKILKNNQYSINDADLIEPEFLSVVSSINWYGNYSYGSAYSSLNSFTLNMYMNNSVSVGDIEFNFSNSFAYTFGDTSNPLSYDFGSWSGSYAFYDSNLKLTFGQVGGSLLSSGTPIGFTLEKTYSYGEQTALPHQFQRHFIIDDVATINIYLNGEIILSKRVKQGEYKFIDFAFQDGANLLIFDINYDDDAYQDINEQYEIAYDSSLLARGDYLYGLSGAIQKTLIDSTSQSLLYLPYFDGSWYEYNLSDFEMKYWVNAGLTDEFTMKTSLSMATDIMALSFEGLLATMHGSYSGSLDLALQNELTPSVDLSVAHTYQTPVGPISASLSLALPEYERPSYDLSTDGSIGLSLGYTFNIWEFPPLSTSLNLTATNSEFTTSSSLGMSYTPAPGLALSTSVSATTSTISDPTFTFTVALSYSLITNLTTSTSFTSDGDSSISASYKASANDSLQFSISNIQYTEESNRPTYSTTWAHTGNVSSLSIRQTASDDFADFNTNASLSTTLYYAGGLFGISGTTSSNFLLLKPSGKLAGSPISISKTNNSSPTLLDSIFGTSVYTDLSANTKNNIIVYGDTNSLFSSGGTFSYELNTGSRSGFTKRMSIPISYTLSGLLYNADGTPYAQYSSPVYTREIDENGNYYLQISENQYLFTDANGRYILNDVSPGYYVFDLQVGKQWYAISFQIPSDEENEGKVVELEDYQVENLDQDLVDWDLTVDAENTDSKVDDIIIDTFGNEIVSEYSKFEFIGIKDVVDEETFAANTQQEFAPTGFDEAISNDDEFVEPDVDPFADTASDWVDDSDSWTF
jgi:outer membrane usher protein